MLERTDSKRGRKGQVTTQEHSRWMRFASPAGLRALVCAAALLGLLFAASPAAAHSGEHISADAEALPKDDLARGLIYEGLEPGREGGPCEGLYEVRSQEEEFEGCTHGPDAAPEGVDVQEHRSIEELLAEARLAGGTPTYEEPVGIGIVLGSANSDGWDPGANARPGLTPPAPKVPCETGNVPPGSIDYGQDGNRVQAIYAYASDLPGGSRYTEVAPLIRAFAGEIDQVFSFSAMKTGGDRHVRFVQHNSVGCPIVVEKVELTPTGDDSFGKTKSELQAKGYDLSGRKYLVWRDVNTTDAAPDLCGIGDMYQDKSKANNVHDGNTMGGMFGLVDPGCWGISATHAPPLANGLIVGGWTKNPNALRGAHAEAHELMHTLGAVQAGSPNSTWAPTATYAGGHCIDEFDIMCYDDDGNPQGSTQDGVVNHPSNPDAFVAKLLRADCWVGDENLFDCNDDDYFSTSPPSGSWLANNWNTADSSFLDRRPAEDRSPPEIRGLSYQQLGSGTPKVPFLVSWRARDYVGQPYCGSGIRSFYLWKHTDGGAGLSGGSWSLVDPALITTIGAGCWLHGSVELALDPGHTYKFWVRAVDGAGNGQWWPGNTLAVP
jgi:hypothetical protein